MKQTITIIILIMIITILVGFFVFVSYELLYQIKYAQIIEVING